MKLDELSEAHGLSLPPDEPSEDEDDLAFWAEAEKRGLVPSAEPPVAG